MNKHILASFIFSVIFIAMAAASSATTMNYSIIVKEHGDAVVIVTLDGAGTTSVPLPLDAVPAVKGAIYVQSPTGIDVQVGDIPAAIVYQTNLYTAKSSNWILPGGRPCAWVNRVASSC